MARSRTNSPRHTRHPARCSYRRIRKSRLMCIHNHIIAAMVAGRPWLFAGIGVLTSVLIWVSRYRRAASRRPGPSTRGRSKLDRRPSRRQRISISRRSRDGARRGDLQHIPERIPLRRTSMSSAKSPLTRNPPKVGSFIRRGPIVSQESALLFGRRHSRVVVSVGRPRFKASRQ